MNLSRNQIATLAILMAGTFTAVLNQTAVAPALPSIMEEMSLDAATVQWLTTGFTLVNAVMIPVTAFLIDRFSVRQLFLTCMTIFALGSALAGWGSHFIVLLTGRLVQAAGAGVLMPLVMTVLLWTFPAEKRGSAMGLFGLVVAFGPAIGPTAAGIIIDSFSWNMTFYLITCLSTVLVVAAFFVLKKGDPTKKSVTLDVLSVALSSLGFGSFLFGLSFLGSYGLHPSALGGIAVGVLALAFFFRRQLKLEHPMLQVRVLSSQKFLIATLIGMIIQGALLSASVLLPIYLQSLEGHSATISGLVVLPGAILMAIMGPIAGRIFDRKGPRMLSLLGMGGITLSTLLLAFIGPETSVYYIGALFTVRLVALALVNMPIVAWGMNSLNDELINHGTSVNNTLCQVAGSFGTAIIVSAYTITANMNTSAMGEIQANYFGISISFAISAAFCLVGFILVVALVKK